MFIQALRNRLVQFRDDVKGVVAVEFAMIMPVMVIIYMGMFQISMVIMQDRHVTHSASVMADLATQVKTLENTDIADIMQAGIQVLQVTNDTTLTSGDIQIEISSWRKLSSGAYERMGFAATGGTWDTLDPSTIDPRMLDDTSGALVARVQYNYKILSNGSGNQAGRNRWIDGSAMLREQFIAKPRLNAYIPFMTSDGNEKAAYSCTIGLGGYVTC
jgi:hypothetical protein